MKKTISEILGEQTICDMVNERTGNLVNEAIADRVRCGAENTKADTGGIFVEMTKHLDIDPAAATVEAEDEDRLCDEAEDEIGSATFTEEGERILADWVFANYPCYSYEAWLVPQGTPFYRGVTDGCTCLRTEDTVDEIRDYIRERAEGVKPEDAAFIAESAENLNVDMGDLKYIMVRKVRETPTGEEFVEVA